MTEQQRLVNDRSSHPQKTGWRVISQQTTCPVNLESQASWPLRHKRSKSGPGRHWRKSGLLFSCTSHLFLFSKAARSPSCAGNMRARLPKRGLQIKSGDGRAANVGWLVVTRSVALWKIFMAFDRFSLSCVEVAASSSRNATGVS